MNMRKNDIKVCLTTELFNSYNNLNATVVVVDLLRATSVISTAFHYGIESIIPVMSLEEALSYKNKPNHIIAAERNTLLIDGFDFGNSPFHYIDKNLKGKTLALTTTNGTKAIHMAKTNKLITASFVNIDAVVDFLPSPLDIPPAVGIDPNTGAEIIRNASDEEPFSACGGHAGAARCCRHLCAEPDSPGQ